MRKILLALLAVSFFGCSPSKKEFTDFQYKRTTLSDNWRLLSSGENINGKDLSSGIILGKGDYKTRVPSTVLNSLVQAGTIKDPYFANNLAKIDTKQFKRSWWYCTSFELNASESKQIARLILDGINYSSNIWINGNLIQKREDIYGAFNQFDIDISSHLLSGKNNIAIEVFPPEPGDFTVGFVDWAPTPPDNNMGIWRSVHLELNGPVVVKNTFIQSDLNIETLLEADLSISTELSNYADDTISGDLIISLGDDKIKKGITLAPKEFRKVNINEQEYSELHIDQPKIWWPNNLGEPNLYTATVEFQVSGKQSGSETKTFGIRKVEDYFNEQGHRGYKVNGKPVVIKGGGWVDDLLLGNTPEYNEAQVRYAKDMNLNCIRFEGFWGSSENIYDLCDQYGMLAMVGWSCHWEWSEYLGKEFPAEEELGGIVSEEEQNLVAGYFEDQVKWLRNHPSIFVWGFGSDFLHRPSLEEKYLAFLKQEDPKRPFLGAHKKWTSDITGPTGVKMEGPYDWVPPVYWYTDKDRGGNFGFNTETGPGPQPPVIESMQKMLPKDSYWPIDTMWNYHAGRHAFGNMDKYNNALTARYGTFDNMEDYCKWSQVASYEAIRPMFESFEQNKPEATGVVQWMLNSAWPETYWQLYDYYLVPTGAYFGTKKACQPLNLIYNYGDNQVYLVNSTNTKYSGLKLRMDAYDSGSEFRQGGEVQVDCEPNSSTPLFKVDWTRFRRNVAMVSLKVNNDQDSVLADNFYWISKTKDEMDDYSTSSWVYTPTKKYADYSELLNLKRATIDVIVNRKLNKNDELEFEVQLKNMSKYISFFNELKVVQENTDQRIFEPIIWSDNYVSLLPNESRLITITVPNETELKYEIKINAINTDCNIQP